MFAAVLTVALAPAASADSKCFSDPAGDQIGGAGPLDLVEICHANTADKITYVLRMKDGFADPSAAVITIALNLQGNEFKYEAFVDLFWFNGQLNVSVVEVPGAPEAAAAPATTTQTVQPQAIQPQVVEREPAESTAVEPTARPAVERTESARLQPAVEPSPQPSPAAAPAVDPVAFGPLAPQWAGMADIEMYRQMAAAAGFTVPQGFDLPDGMQIPAGAEVAVVQPQAVSAP